MWNSEIWIFIITKTKNNTEKLLVRDLRIINQKHNKQFIKLNNRYYSDMYATTQLHYYYQNTPESMQRHARQFHAIKTLFLGQSEFVFLLLLSYLFYLLFFSM